VGLIFAPRPPSHFSKGTTTCITNNQFIISNLMAPDEMKNLGFAEGDNFEPIPNHAGGATAHKVRDDGKKIS